jgi:hypothetical protein
MSRISRCWLVKQTQSRSFWQSASQLRREWQAGFEESGFSLSCPPVLQLLHRLRTGWTAVLWRCVPVTADARHAALRPARGE